jgi:hypothetical protein
MDDIRALVARLREVDTRLRALRPKGEPYYGSAQPDAVLGPPATASDLARLESESLPARYLAFLALHDGWAQFPDHRGPTRLLSCAELVSPALDPWRREVKSWRGLKTMREVQRALVIGGGEQAAYFLLPPDGKGVRRVRDVQKKWLSFGEHEFDQFLQSHIRTLENLVEDALAARPVADEGEADRLLDDAIADFNYPEEQGEYVDDSVESIRAHLARLPRGAFAEHRRVIDRLRRELTQDGAFSLARKTASGVELYDHARKVWKKI